MPGDMEMQIHHIEQEAYTSVLRAFKAQADAITWEQESLITELRKELRVSDEEHRELLSRVNADDIIGKIRHGKLQWRKRKASGFQPGMASGGLQPSHDQVPSSTSSSHKKKKKSKASLPLVAPSPACNLSNKPSSSIPKRGLSRTEGKNPQPIFAAAFFIKSMQYPVTGFSGRHQAPPVQTSSGPVGTANFDPLIRRKVLSRTEDENIYEAFITDYNPLEISPDDIQLESDGPRKSSKGSHNGKNQASKKSVVRGGASAGSGRGKGVKKSQLENNIIPTQSGTGKGSMGDIEILHTDTLLEQVEKVCAYYPEPDVIEKSKKVLKEHEQALVDAIGRLEEASDGESALVSVTSVRPCDVVQIGLRPRSQKDTRCSHIPQFDQLDLQQSQQLVHLLNKVMGRTSDTLA
nr:protein EMSY-LIKE 3-like isoform X1 [Ipomoea batatas]